MTGVDLVPAWRSRHRPGCSACWQSPPAPAGLPPRIHRTSCSTPRWGVRSRAASATARGKLHPEIAHVCTSGTGNRRKNWLRACSRLYSSVSCRTCCGPMSGTSTQTARCDDWSNTPDRVEMPGCHPVTRTLKMLPSAAECADAHSSRVPLLLWGAREAQCPSALCASRMWRAIGA